MNRCTTGLGVRFFSVMSAIGGERSSTSTFSRFRPQAFAFFTRIEACITEMNRPVARSSLRSRSEAEVILTFDRREPRASNAEFNRLKMTGDGGRIQGASQRSSSEILRILAHGLVTPAMIQWGSSN